MKEFIDKLISRLEEYKTKAYVTGITNNPYEFGACNAMDSAIRIVTELAEEYNNESVKGDLISKSAVIKELNEIYLDNPWDNKEDILEKAIGIVDHIPTVYVPAPYTEGE